MPSYFSQLVRRISGKSTREIVARSAIAASLLIGTASITVSSNPAEAQARWTEDTHVFCNGHTEPIELKIKDPTFRGPQGEDAYIRSFRYLRASSRRYFDASAIIEHGNCGSWTSDVHEDSNPVLGVFVNSNASINPNGGTLMLSRRDFREDLLVAKKHYYACTSIGCYYSYSE